MSVRLLLPALALTLPLVACKTDGGDGDADGTDPDGSADGPTWYQDVAPIVSENCAGCHGADAISFPMDEYNTVVALAGAMAHQVETGQMPPWAAFETDDCVPENGFADDLRLTPEEIQIIREWADAGAPEGDAANPAELRQTTVVTLEGVTHTVAPEVGYAASGDADEFVCFSMPLDLDQTMYLTGAEVIPGNVDVDHHALVFVDSTGKSADLANEDGYYPCFGGIGLAQTQLIGAWAPGALPFEAPPDAGTELTPGSRLVMQMHYNPRGNQAALDVTQVNLRLTDVEPRLNAEIALLGNFDDYSPGGGGYGLLPGPNDAGDQVEFRIPAGESDHTETMKFKVTADFPEMQVFLAGAHMHWIGKDMEIRVQRANPEAGESADECLIQTPKYDFEWQRGYTYDVDLANAPTIGPGDTIWMQCTYDNTLDHKGTRAALEAAELSEPVDVYLGDETLDEMCLAVLGITHER